MREALKEFRDAVHREGERSAMPTLRTIVDRREAAPVLQWRWAAGVVVALVLAAVPVYRNTQQRQREAEQQRADAVLMEQVNGAISRPVPMALAVLMGN